MYMKESGCYMYQGMWKALAVTAISRTKSKILQFYWSTSNCAV